MTSKKYPAPPFVMDAGVTEDSYSAWLARKAQAQHRRDKKRFPTLKESVTDYKQKIHRAVEASQGVDHFTGEELDWGLIGKWRNEDATNRAINQKKKFNRLPTVDHFSRKNGKNQFVICSWQINDMKNDNEYSEFLELCWKVLNYAEATKRSR